MKNCDMNNYHYIHFLIIRIQFICFIKKFNLRIDQGGVIENEVFLVMLGFQEADDFLENIIREGDISKEVASALEKEVGAVIFAPLRQALMQKIDEKEEEIKKTTTTSSQSLESREDLLKQIEDPSEIPMVASITPSISSNKITYPVQNVAVAAQNLSAVPIAPITSTPKIDPYREPIE